MWVENHYKTLDVTHHKSIDIILFALKEHYQSCFKLVEYKTHQTLSRAAKRFLKVESSMISEIKLKILNSKSENHHAIQEDQPVVINSYDEMYQSNRQLISYLKSAIRKFNNKNLSSFFSYWVAALQVENDEMAKHL